MELPEPPHLETLRGWCYRIHYREDVVYISGRVRETVDQEGAFLSKSRYLYFLHFFSVCARLTGKSNHVLYTRLPTSFLGPRNTAHAV